MTTYDLILAIYDYYNQDMTETVLAVNDIIEQIKSGAEYFNTSLESELDMFTEINGACPQCGNILVKVGESNEARGEYFGTQVTEKEVLYGCDTCNYTIG